MKVVIAIDSFKGSMTSLEAGSGAAEGIKRVYPHADTVVIPVADGGEGTVDALVLGMGGTKECVKTKDPLGRDIEAYYGIVGNTAVMEMAAASGITLVKEDERNPLNTSTYGFGLMILSAIEKGCRKFVIGIGGSATNDGGVGMLSALGFEFLDKKGEVVEPGAKGLENLCSIKANKALKELKECSFSIACDVTNPLCGKDGCSWVYGPQKGATDKMVKDMDSWLSGYALLAKTINPMADENAPGAGAAGGMGFAFMTFLGGELKSGIDLILRETRIEEHIKTADLVITGEGRLDFQTAMGKAPAGIAAIAKKHKKPVIAFAGGVTPEAKAVHGAGIDAYFPIVRGVCTLADAMDNANARSNMADSVEQALRLIKKYEQNQ